jgi:crotonobetainyl-CoA:carnitine CoA-transferase CaiB-like acyl-CoA transferase
MKVIELASVLAGPSVGMFFAELGARVLKIENKKTAGDVTRSWKLSLEDPENSISAYYASVNYHKEVIFLDLNEIADKEWLYNEIKDADILIANYRQKSAMKLGVDYQSLKVLNPKLIYGNISGFGEDSDRVAFDVVLQAESGFMYMNGQPDGPATKMPVALIDVLAAHQLKEGLLYALWQREISGAGAYVSVSLIEAALSALSNQASNWLMAGHLPQRMGSKHPNIAPYGEFFSTKDGKQIVLAVGNDHQFTNLCKILNVFHIAENIKFADNFSRIKHRNELELELEKAFFNFDAKYLLEEAEKMAVPLGLIRNMKEVFDLQIANELILDETIEGQETKRLKSLIFKYNKQ